MPLQKEEEAIKLLEEKVAKDLDKPIVDLVRTALAPNPEDRPKDKRIFRRELKKLTEARRKSLGWS